MFARNFNIFSGQCIYNEIDTHSSKRATIRWLVCTNKGVHDLRGTAYTMFIQHKLSYTFFKYKKKLTQIFNNIKIEIEHTFSFNLF